MKSWSIAIVITVLALGGVLAAQQKGASSMPTGKAFLTKAADINLDEVYLGKLAEQKGSDPAVKDFGKRMIEDHTKAEDELQPLAKREGVTLPAKPGADAVSLHQQLSGASGAEFDKTYIEHMLAGHKGAISTFENEIEHDSNAAIKGYAESTLPVIQDHIRLAENVAGKMGMSGAKGLSAPSKAITASGTPK